MSDCAKGRHHNIYFNREVMKYGESNFNLSIIAECYEYDKLCYLEKYYISLYRLHGEILYNITDGGDGVTGYKYSDERREKFIKSMIGNKYAVGYRHTEETKKRMSEIRKGKSVNIGRKHTEESKKKMSNSRMGDKNHFYGKKHSEETKNLIRLKCTGVRHSEETKKKMSMSHLGKKLSENHCLNISIGKIGMILSEDTKKERRERMKETNSTLGAFA
jgi:hypothetical protein